jgi:hypothetical protein
MGPLHGAAIARIRTALMLYLNRSGRMIQSPDALLNSITRNFGAK